MEQSLRISNGVKKIWNVKIRQSIKKEFPSDPMMQELHEIRARLSKKYKAVKKIGKLKKEVEQPFFGTINVR